MMDKKNVSRLGEILLEKGLVTSQQLDVAIKEQINRRQRIDPLDSKLHESTSLGEILIELGFIDRLQLNRGLNWQLLLRKLTIAMALLAPLMTISTGATAQSSSASSVASSQSSAIKTLPILIQAEDYTSMSGIKTQATTDTGGGLNVGYIDNADWISYSGTVISIPVTGAYKITYRIASPGGGGSFALKEANGSVTYDTVPVPNTGDFQQWVNVERIITLSAGNHAFMITFIARGQGINLNWFKIESVVASSSSSVSSSKPSSSSKSSTSSSQASSSAVSAASQTSSASSGTIVSVAGSVGFSWQVPTTRENGDPLDITELGGYELRYRPAANPNFAYITINDPWVNYYNFSWLVGDYVFQVAAFDKSGVYSNFVDVTPL